MKIFVGVTCYCGQPHPATQNSLKVEQRKALAQGDEITEVRIRGMCYIERARNEVARLFLESDCDRLVFIDHDVSWKPGDLLKLAHNPEPFVAGVYRAKQEEEKYPIEPLKKGFLEVDDRGMIALRHVPFGFVALSRSVFDRFMDRNPKRMYLQGKRFIPLFFWCPYAASPYEDEGETKYIMNLYGEDVFFCVEWQAMGGEVWADPSLEIDHHRGADVFRGRFKEWLERQREPVHV